MMDRIYYHVDLVNPDKCLGFVIMGGPTDLTYRGATIADVPAIMQSRSTDPDWGPADPRTALYLEGKHDPQFALPPRTIFVALEGDTVVGYIAGHLTERYDCAGELQYLWVAIDYRRSGVASRLFQMQAQWFVAQNARRICVDVLPDNARARFFYLRHGAKELNPHWLVWNDIAAGLADQKNDDKTA